MLLCFGLAVFTMLAAVGVMATFDMGRTDSPFLGIALFIVTGVYWWIL